MKRLFSLALTAIILLVSLACAPQAAPSPSLTPLPPQALAPTKLVPTPPPSQEDIAWQKVVEAAKKEDKLTIYSFSMTGDVGLATAKAFKNRYGITADIITGRGAEFIERIKVEQRMKQVTADWMDASATHVLTLKAAGCTISSQDIPILREKDIWSVDPQAVDSEGHALVLKVQNLSPWVNTNLVKSGKEPMSYRDLAKPEWKGKILLADPSLSAGAYMVFLSLVDRKYLDMELVRSLRDQDLRFVPGNKDIARALSRGEASFGLPVSDADADPFVKEGAPIKAIALEEGTVTSLVPGASIKGGPHPNAAKLFMNWILSTEGQAVYIKAAGAASLRKDVPDFRQPAAAVVPKRLVPITEEDSQRQADAFRDKLLVQLWKK